MERQEPSSERKTGRNILGHGSFELLRDIRGDTRKGTSNDFLDQGIFDIMMDLRWETRFIAWLQEATMYNRE